MDKLAALPIDWANVNWPYVSSLIALVFVCAFFGSALSLGRTGRGSVVTALLFAMAFIFWTYYPHDLPLPTLVTPQKTAPSANAQPPWLQRDPAESKRY
jgi:hypothetical protein